jgi:2-amino-4-hydroxy-6-hydroxymethyldihydropteridine diphosphokinase
VSRLHWTEPWGFDHPDLFLNQAVVLATAMPPQELMQACLAMERDLGRVRAPDGRMEARTIDLDLLLVGTIRIVTEALVLPHPRMHQRAFALAPAADVAPMWMHPVLGRTVLDLLDELRR